MSRDGHTVVPHIDEIDTSRRDWANDIDKIRKEGGVYRVKIAVHSGEVYFVKEEQ